MFTLAIDRAETRGQLLLERAELLGRFHDALARADVECDAFDRRSGDHARHWYARLVVTLSNRDLDALGEIIAALDRVEDGSYESCVACGADIDGEWHAEHQYSVHCSDCAVTADIATLVPR